MHTAHAPLWCLSGGPDGLHSLPSVQLRELTQQQPHHPAGRKLTSQDTVTYRGASLSPPSTWGPRATVTLTSQTKRTEVQGGECVTLVGTATGLCAESCRPPCSTGTGSLSLVQGWRRKTGPGRQHTSGLLESDSREPRWDRGCFQLPCPAWPARVAPSGSESSQSS